jgi:hypothetical protein
MELFIGVIVLVVILFLFMRNEKKGGGSSASISKEEKILNENSTWMTERWELAKKEKATSFPKWFFDDATKRQLEKIDELGVKVSLGSPSKGQASDIIGLFESMEDDKKEILMFFKFPLKKMNESRARYEVEKIFRNVDNIEKWSNRPASPMQKEFYNFFGIKAPKGITFEVASKDIKEHLSNLPDEDEQKETEWDAYEELYDEINDTDFRNDYGLKKISPALYRKAINMLKAEGKTIIKISEDADIVVDKIIEIKPDIEKG